MLSAFVLLSCEPPTQVAEVKMFTQPDCGRCASVKEAFKENGVVFEEFSTEEHQNRVKLREYVPRSVKDLTMPVVVVDTNVFYNFEDLDPVLHSIFGLD